MKWNWGTGIALTFTVFCALIIAAVVRSFQEDVDLVTEEYYREEIAYQQRINDQENAVTDADALTINQTKDLISFVFKGNGNLSGEIHFYRPDDPALDKRILVDSRTMVVPKVALASGRYKVKLSWKDNGKSYYKEEVVFI